VREVLTHDITLGATRGNVLGMVARQAMALIAAGLIVVVGAALALGSVMQKMLFGVSPRDPATLAAIVAVLAVVGMIASFVPARRATRVDPIVALRSE
jgi:putative ABC transport system permease protein